MPFRMLRQEQFFKFVVLIICQDIPDLRQSFFRQPHNLFIIAFLSQGTDQLFPGFWQIFPVFPSSGQTAIILDTFPAAGQPERPFGSVLQTRPGFFHDFFQPELLF